jgi:tetratricopeptide (TPR) repeat protein
MEKFDNALEHFQQAARLRPDWPIPLNGMALILLKHPNPQRRNIDKVIELSRQAAELTNYSNISILETLTTAYASKGQYDQALAIAQIGLKIAAAANNNEKTNYFQNQINIHKSKIRK